MRMPLDQNLCQECGGSITAHEIRVTPTGRMEVYCRTGRHCHSWSQADLRHFEYQGLVLASN
jgi:hypothetical protein